MPVNLSPPPPLPPVAGVAIGTTRAIKAKNRDDLAVFAIAPGAAVAGMFTRNHFPAPPVTVCRQRLAGNTPIRALAVNAGIANAGTLGGGLQDARDCCKKLAALLGVRPAAVLPFSTGVIMERLPMEKYAAGLERCVAALRPDNWNAAARAIMTTDTIPKGAFRRVSDGDRVFTVAGVAKGSGMIHPNMATMLAFIAADAEISPFQLRAWQRPIADTTFNAISVDGDTSTNDSFIMIATGKAGRPSRAGRVKVRTAFEEVAAELAQAVVRDGEGATKLLTIRVQGASGTLRRRVAEAVARSPLVKTALAAGDANIGRFLMAIGNSTGFVPDTVAATLGGVPIISRGGIHPDYREEDAAAAMRADEVELAIHLDDHPGETVLTTCDLTAEYIRINAAYRS